MLSMVRVATSSARKPSLANKNNTFYGKMKRIPSSLS